MKKTAVVLFNLGGPDNPAAVRPFLINLFSDPAIINLPHPFRWILARFIARRRTQKAREIYRQIGGGSPILALTEAQGRALEKELINKGDIKVFVAMRYWHPFSGETAQAVKNYAPDHIVLLPLYPQFSGTTSGSSIKDWKNAAAKIKLAAITHVICCYPTAPKFIAAHVDLIKSTLRDVPPDMTPRILFSAHGLPKKIIAAGDPYQHQVEQTVAAIVAELKDYKFDWVICYQSKVGPLEWIGPSTEDEIMRAGRDGSAIVMVPIAFVSEHSETLVELDMTYRQKAESSGVPSYHRVLALGTHPDFIAALADLVREVVKTGVSATACASDCRGCFWSRRAA